MPSTDKVAATVRETAVNGGAGGVSRSRGLLDHEILAHAIVDALRKFNPRAQVRNPVMFVVLIGTIVTLAEAIAHPSIFTWSVTIWLALTVGFANFAEALAEGRGKAQANALRRMRTETDGRRGPRRRPWQGPGQRPAPDADRDRRPPSAARRRRGTSRRGGTGQGGPGHRRGRRCDPLRRGDHPGRGIGR